MQPIIITGSQNRDFQILPPGQYPARCISIVDIGTHDSEYKGVKGKKREIRLTFEFPTKTAIFNPKKGEQPYILSRFFTFSLNEKSRLKPFLDPN